MSRFNFQQKQKQALKVKLPSGIRVERAVKEKLPQVEIQFYLERHAGGDYGELDDKTARSIKQRFVFGIYPSARNVILCVIKDLEKEVISVEIAKPFKS